MLKGKILFLYHKDKFFSLLLDMNELFEKYVAAILTHFLPKRYTVQSQRIITKAITMNGTSYRYIIPDLVVTDGLTGSKLVCDTKYKNYNRRKIATEDIFQLTFYAQYFYSEHNQPHRSVIIYPRYSGEDSFRKSVELLLGTPYYGILSAVDISVEETLELIKSRGIKELEWIACGLLRKAF